MWDWDEAKRQANQTKHGLDFAALDGFDWRTATHQQDIRTDYSEARIVTTGYIGQRLYVLAWTPRNGRVRIIARSTASKRARVETEATVTS
mgnify:CR=1 FL=1